MAWACLTENEVQAPVEGALGRFRVESIESHLDACPKCELLMAAEPRTTLRRPDHPDRAPTAGSHLQLGQIVSGRYRITRFIARGGMSEVYAAYDQMLGAEIALKILLDPASTAPDALSRLRAEVQLARRVKDPHVLKVFDIGAYRSSEGDGSEIPFLTMELLPGETLRERLRRAGPLPPAEVWQLAGDMFAALGAAHQMGIVHRDFNSANVMLVPTPGNRPRAVVMDFGLAQEIGTDAPLKKSPAPLIAGTLGYMAPDQLDGGVVTAAADVYAFGVVLHEMLTGVLPPFRPRFRGRYPDASSSTPLLLARLNIPARWSALIRRCLARDPAARFSNMIEARDSIADRARLSRPAVVAAIAMLWLATIIGVMCWTRALPPADPARQHLSQDDGSAPGARGEATDLFATRRHAARHDGRATPRPGTHIQTGAV